MVSGNKREKQTTRERMARTGESYTTALYAIRAEHAQAKAACPCGCAARRGDSCTCTEPCPCSPNCGYCDADTGEEGDDDA